MPQALLFLILMVMLTMLFLNVMLFTLAPQYVMYGSQRYVVRLLYSVVTSDGGWAVPSIVIVLKRASLVCSNFKTEPFSG